MMHRTRFMLGRVAIIVTSGIIIAAAARPQTQSAGFEVASVRLWTRDAPISQRITDGRLDFTNQTLRALLRFAFRVRDYEMFGPDWLSDVRVNIQATLPSGATRQQVPDMLQRVLIERFGIVARREVRTMEAYDLVVGKDGIRMREVEPVNDLDTFFPRDPGFTSPAAIALADTVADTPDGAVRTVMGNMGRTTVTARTRYTLRTNVERRTRTLEAKRMSMTELAAALADSMDKPVADKTGLSGLYEFKVDLPLDATTVAELFKFGLPLKGDPQGVSESRAAEALGLRLERSREPISVLVIDKINRAPTEN